MSDEKKNLPARRDRATFLDLVRSSKALSATSKKETLAKAIQSESRPRLLFTMDATASREPLDKVLTNIDSRLTEVVSGWRRI